MKKNEYRCTMCGNIYQFAWSDEEAKEEAVEYYGKEMAENDHPSIVCDDCYEMVKRHPEKLARAKKEFYSKRN